MAAREVAIIIKAKDQASKVFEGVGSRLAGIGKVAMAGAAVGVAALGAAITKFAIDAAPLADIEKGFHSLAKTYEIDSEAMLAAMGKASRGTVADIELMRQANRALVGSGKELGQEFGKALPKLLQIARASAKLTGEDVGYLFESLVLGIKRSSPMIIDNTGLQIKLGEANEALAVKLGKTVDELSSQERSIALLNATMEAGESMVASMGDSQLTAAEQMAVMRAQVKQVTFELGKAFLPVLSRILKAVIPLASSLAKKLVPAAEKFAKVLDRFMARASKRLGPFIKLLGRLPEAFRWLQAGDVDMFLERLWVAIDMAFGDRSADLVMNFAERIRDLADRISRFIDRAKAFAGRIGDMVHAIRNILGGWEFLGMEQLKVALAELVGPRIGGYITGFVEKILSIKDAGVGLWQDHLYPRFVAIREGLRAWWAEIGGVAGILATIRAGWQTRIVDPVKNFYESSGLQARFRQIGTGISEWWDQIGGASGALGRIKAGWKTHIAEPLSGFYSAHLGPRLHAIAAGIRAWWAQQEGAGGIMIKIAAGWNKYIAQPLVGFWEAHLKTPFEALTTQVGIWAQTIWDFIEERILKPIRDQFPQAVEDTTSKIEGVAAELAGLEVKEEPRKGILGYLDRFKGAWKEAYAGGPGFYSLVKSLGRLFAETAKAIWAAVRALFFMAIFAIPKLLKAAADLVIGFFEVNEKLRNMIEELLGVKRTVSESESMWDRLSGWTNRLAVEIGIAARGVNRLTQEWRGFRREAERPIVVPRITYPKVGLPLRGYQRGGIVPGPMGRPQMAMVHGGETILPARQQSGVVFNFQGAQFYGITQDFVEDLFKEHELIRELQGVRARNP